MGSPDDLSELRAEWILLGRNEYGGATFVHHSDWNPMSWTLPPILSARLSAIATDLRDELDDLQSVYDGQSERWQESDKATTIQGWIEELYDLADSIENHDSKPDL